MRRLIALLFLSFALPSAARAEDYNFAEPTDVRLILTEIAARGKVNVVVGDQVKGLTTYVGRDRAPEAALIEAARGAGFTIRKRENLLAIRSRSIHVSRVDEDPPGYFRRGMTIDLTLRDRSAREVLGETAAQLDVPYRLNRHSGGRAVVQVERVDPKVFLNLFCEAMGFGWGTTRNVLVVAPWALAPHYVVEMGVDRRTD